MRLVVLGGLMLLGGCGGGGTTGTNYSEPPPMATIVATPTLVPSPTTATPEPQVSNVAEANAATAE
jgi:hypothetical protein